MTKNSISNIPNSSSILPASVDNGTIWFDEVTSTSKISIGNFVNIFGDDIIDKKLITEIANKIKILPLNKDNNRKIGLTLQGINDEIYSPIEFAFRYLQYVEKLNNK